MVRLSFTAEGGRCVVFQIVPKYNLFRQQELAGSPITQHVISDLTDAATSLCEGSGLVNVSEEDGRQILVPRKGRSWKGVDGRRITMTMFLMLNGV